LGVERTGQWVVEEDKKEKIHIRNLPDYYIHIHHHHHHGTHLEKTFSFVY
jgi:hypothetical protein